MSVYLTSIAEKPISQLVFIFKTILETFFNSKREEVLIALRGTTFVTYDETLILFIQILNGSNKLKQIKKQFLGEKLRQKFSEN